jgi:hypothetical protein
MFWANWPSDVQVVEETAASLSCCYTLHFKSVKYMHSILKLFLKCHAVIILLYACVVGLVYLYYIMMDYISVCL